MNHQMISVQYKFQPVGGQVPYFKDFVKSIKIWKESLNIDGQQFHQYQQN